jgi:hypothetical protein
MIREHYRNEGGFFKPQRLVALDDIAFKPWFIDGKAHPKKWLCCGLICFELERSKEQVFAALESAEGTYCLQEYAVWCHPSTLSEGKAILGRLPLGIRNKTTIHSLAEIWKSQQQGNLLIYSQEEITPAITNSDIYWQIKESVSKYGLTFAAVFEMVKPRLEQIFQSLITESYLIEEISRRETHAIYRIEKTVESEPPQIDLKLSNIKKLSKEKLKELDSKMLSNFIVVDDTDATDEDRETLLARIRFLLNRTLTRPSEPDILLQVSPPQIDGRKSIVLGLEYQRKVTDACRDKGWIIEGSIKRGKADILRFDEQHRVVMVVIAVKSYTLEVTIEGKSCHNCKGHKYVVSFKASRDAKAEVEAAREYGLNRIWLICGNLRTGKTIYSGYVGLDDNVTLKERQQDQSITEA